jgi:hypothetical protein
VPFLHKQRFIAKAKVSCNEQNFDFEAGKRQQAIENKQKWQRNNQASTVTVALPQKKGQQGQLFLL